MKKSSYHLIALCLLSCILFQLTDQLKYPNISSNSNIMRYQEELIGDFAKDVILPKENTRKVSNY